MRILASAFIFGAASFVNGSVDTPARDIFEWFSIAGKLQELRTKRAALSDEYRELYGTEPAERDWEKLKAINRQIRDLNLFLGILQLELDEINAHIDANSNEPYLIH